MLLALFLLLALADPEAVPSVTSMPTDACAPATGWSDGRGGQTANVVCATASSYVEAHRLGDAMRRLEAEHAAIALELPTLDAELRNTQLRRQRQIDTDIEALRGVATIRAWPTETTGEPAR